MLHQLLSCLQEDILLIDQLLQLYLCQVFSCNINLTLSWIILWLEGPNATLQYTWNLLYWIANTLVSIILDTIDPASSSILQTYKRHCIRYNLLKISNRIVTTFPEYSQSPCIYCQKVKHMVTYIELYFVDMVIYWAWPWLSEDLEALSMARVFRDHLN